MKISVIIPCLNEELNISKCLNSLINQSYHKSDYEIIVIDGGSKDKTSEIVNEIQKKYPLFDEYFLYEKSEQSHHKSNEQYCPKETGHNPDIRFVIDLKRGTAAGRNRGIQEAKFDYIAFIDADCTAPFEWLETLVNGYQNAKRLDSSIAGVGGGNLAPENTDNFIKAVGIALDSYLGSFGSIQGRRFKQDGYVSSIATLNALYEKAKLEEIGYYDESLRSEAEDAELNYRLTKAGYKLFYITNSYVWHNMRATPKGWFKNMFRYGKGRARLLKRYPDMWKFQYLLPIFFIVLITLFSFASFLLLFFNAQPVLLISKALLLIGLYFPAIVFYSLFKCVKKRDIALVFHVASIYFIQHFGYALGESYGLFNNKVF